jgi:hypothetical protein
VKRDSDKIFTTRRTTTGHLDNETVLRGRKFLTETASAIQKLREPHQQGISCTVDASRVCYIS